MRGTPFGRYELLRKIAAGGMAEIFLARQWGEGGFFRDVVIKRLFRHMAEHETALRMFQYEARLLAELCHPNIPQVFELGFEQGTWYMAMEHVDGATVADVWRAGARQGQVMPLPVAIGVAVQACEALHHAHERRDRADRPLRIVHRDVTPHNMMLTRDGVTKLMDFGVAQTAARKDTEAGTVKGTFSYMAPEQVRAKPLDKRADVFALGVILYELTTGTRLFRGNDVQVMTAIVEQDAPRPTTAIPNYPQELEDIVMAALARDRSRRLPSAAHVALTLEDFALRNGLLIGPRAVSRYVSTIYPYQRAKEPEAAMVELERLELVPDADTSGPWAAELDRDRTEEVEADIDESGILDDLALLSPADSPAVSDLVEPVQLPDDELDLRDDDEPMTFEDTTQNDASGADIDTDRPTAPADLPEPLTGFEDEASNRPVVLLPKPKQKGEPRDGDYVRDLERRLDEED